MINFKNNKMREIGGSPKPKCRSISFTSHLLAFRAFPRKFFKVGIYSPCLPEKNDVSPSPKIKKAGIGKKAESFFIPLVTAAAIFALIYFYIHFSASFDGSDEAPIGSYAASLYITDAESEKFFLFLDQAAKISFDKTVLELGEYGGNIPFTEENHGTSCGSYVFALWNSKTSTCKPDYENNFKQYFDQKILGLMSINPYTSVYIDFDYTLASKEGRTTLKATTPNKIGFDISLDYLNPDRLGKGEGNVIECPVSLKKISSITVCTAKNCFLNPETAILLEKTAKDIMEKEGYSLKIFYAHRLYEEQKQLYDSCKSLSCEKEIDAPSCNAPFVTGGAIGIEVYDGQGNMLNTGSWGLEKSYENQIYYIDQLAVHKKIEAMMCRNGWVRAADESSTRGKWWQFEYKTPRWYDAQELSEKENRQVCSIK